MTSEELINEIRRRKTIVTIYEENYRKYLEVNEYSKASELLWGIVNNYIETLSLLITGRIVGKHSEVREFIKYLSRIKNNSELIDLFESCEILHANFYHNFLDEESFKYHRSKAEKLIRILEEYLIEELSKRNIII